MSNWTMDDGRLTMEGWLTQATKQLNAVDIPSARLDAELLLTDDLGVNRTWVISHADEPLIISDSLAANLQRRVNREPLAYIRGYKEFYGRDFIVTPDVLIPRPESEEMIELLKQLADDGRWTMDDGTTIIDVGTGSGALAITAALELPNSRVYACDISSAALLIARRNADVLGAKVSFYESDLLAHPSSTVHRPPSIIVANLPYVDRTWSVSPETAFEPKSALFAENEGLALINKLVAEAPRLLMPQGHLLLEADPKQHTAITQTAEQHGFSHVASQGYALLFKRTV